MEKQLFEDGFIIASIALTTAALFHGTFEIADFFVNYLLISWFFYTKIPLRLDSYFRTTAFREDLSIKSGIVLFPALMFLVFTLGRPFGFLLLPQGLKRFALLSVDASVLGVIAVALLSIIYFSWRAWNCPDTKLAMRLWRKTCESDEEFEHDLALSSESRIDHYFNRLVSPGAVPMGITVILFFAAYVLMIIDVLLVILLACWLAYNILFEVGRRSSDFSRRSNSAYKFFKNLDRVLVWESLLRFGLVGRMENVVGAIIVTGCFLLLITISIISLEAFIVMFGFLCQWYVLVVLIQIARRTRYRPRALRNESLLPSLPNYSNVVLPFCLTLLLVFSLGGYLDLTESQLFMRAFTIMSLSLNVGVIVSVVLWARSGKRPATQLRMDRYRLFGIFYLSGLFVALAGKSIQGVIFWTALSGALIFLTTQRSIHARYQRSDPKICATATTLHFAIGVYTILGTAAYFFPELSFLMLSAAMLSGVLFLLMWVQTFRIRTLAQTE
ncbi:MAG: hypothetical protein JSV85_01905 [Candidatus Bathyarchaeota archaeon]|nr:MAG: hypothetical protein JSV85_01905 [Candidatus Bathyarchaeota archaeon]